jgi:hypothetical protein
MNEMYSQRPILILTVKQISKIKIEGCGGVRVYAYPIGDNSAFLICEKNKKLSGSRAANGVPRAVRLRGPDNRKLKKNKMSQPW